MEKSSLFCLRVINGRYGGQRIVLGQSGARVSDGVCITLGRYSDLDIVLDEDIVSREHARIEIHLNHIHIYDLESMNGIFVNNKRVGEAELVIGDKIRIGSNIFILDPNLASSSQTHVKNAISGSLQNIDIGTLLRFIENIKTSGTLNIGTEGQRASIHFLEGKIRCAEFLDEQKERTSLEVMDKILSWTSGSFKLRPSAKTTCESNLNLRVSDLLLSHLGVV